MRYSTGSILALALVVISSIVLLTVYMNYAPTPDSDPIFQAEKQQVDSTDTRTRYSTNKIGHVSELKKHSSAELPDAEDVEESWNARSNTLVWGSIKTKLGHVVPGEEIKLVSRSTGKRYLAVSNDQGDYVIENVQPASDYSVSVTPQGMFKKYLQSDVELGYGEEILNIVLDPLRTGLLQGRLLNTDNQPVSDFEISVRSLSKNLGEFVTKSNSVGLFQIDDFPEGRFEAISRDISLLIKGLEFDVRSNGIIELLVHQGPYALTGRVFDPNGQAVEGATVLLSRKQIHDGVKSSINRLTLTAPGGVFEFKRLSSGEHQLHVENTTLFRAHRSVFIDQAPQDVILYLEHQ